MGLMNVFFLVTAVTPPAATPDNAVVSTTCFCGSPLIVLTLWVCFSTFFPLKFPVTQLAGSPLQTESSNKQAGEQTKGLLANLVVRDSHGSL